MKNTVLFITAFILSTFITTADNNPLPSTKKSAGIEKEFLLEYYERTYSNLERHVEGLTEEQLRFSPSDEAWNIQQCLEHILIVERSLYHSVMEILSRPETPENREELQLTDDEIIQMMENRDRKAKAPEAIHPKGEFSNAEEIMEALRILREEMLVMIDEISGDDLRNRFGDSPIGVVDAHQYFLIIAAHTARHTSQIEEIKSSREFPRE